MAISSFCGSIDWNNECPDLCAAWIVRKRTSRRNHRHAIVQSRHIPCASCGYDVFQCDPTGSCPECEQSIQPSLDSGRLFFEEPRTLKMLWIALVLGLIYLVSWITNLGVAAIFLLSIDMQFFVQSVWTTVASVGLWLLSIAYARGADSAIRGVTAIVFSVCVCATATVKIVLCQLVIDYVSQVGALRHVAAMLAVFEEEGTLQSIVERTADFTMFAGICWYHLLSGLLIARIPDRHCSRAFYLTAALVALTGAGTWFLEEYPATSIAWGLIFMGIAIVTMSGYSFLAAIRATSRVISVKQEMERRNKEEQDEKGVESRP